MPYQAIAHGKQAPSLAAGGCDHDGRTILADNWPS